MNLITLKKIFNREAKILYAERNKVFTVDSDNKNFLKLLCKYFAKDLSFETEHGGSLNKGLFIYGNPGSGKTTSLDIIRNISLKYNIRQLWFPKIEAYEVVNKYNMDKNKDSVIINYSKGNFMFDDIGGEHSANNIHVFGKEDIFIRIFLSRYNEFVNKGTKTYITSNLPMPAIKKRYGERVEDRFYEMFNLLELNVTGEGRR
ncbi:hypothetical protein [Maribacter luteus]|uniref:hypothetical protein n=1 Tax=Maribacter luteus TaxID=2594478 RepID=UPI002492F567|nr:hypothetical protein [Maribacter luteus]